MKNSKNLNKSNILKLIKILFINTLIFVLLYFAIDYIVEQYDWGKVERNIKYKNLIDEFNEDISEIYPETFKFLDSDDKLFNKFCGENRVNINTKYNKKPIIIFGCSYAYGYGLKKEDSFPYLISYYSHHPVYNYASCGKEIWYSLKKFESDIKNNNSNVLKNADYSCRGYFQGFRESVIDLPGIKLKSRSRFSESC